MGRIDGLSIQRNTNDASLKMLDMSRVKTSRHIKREGILLEDTIGNSPKIEHFNNYNSNGVHVNNVKTTPIDSINVSETSVFKYELYSIYTKSGIEVFVSSATHSPPVLFFEDYRAEIKEITAYIDQGVQDFMAGKIGADGIANIIEKAYRDILAYNILLGNTDGTDPHYNARLLFNTQTHFCTFAGGACLQANDAEGLAYGKEKYGLWSGDGFAYYNSKYYFLSKELKDIGTATIAHIAQSEGFDFYNVQGHKPMSFNEAWQATVGNVKMINTGIEPPKDFIMFFTAQRYSFQDVWNNGGKNVMINAIDPTRTDGHGSVGCFFTVPKNWQMFKSLPFWLKQGTYTNEDGKNYVTWDITKHMKFNAGDDVLSRVKEFFDEYLNDPNHGELVVWSGGTKSVHNVPFDLWFDEKRAFQGSELTAAIEHNSFIKNFEFRVF